MNIREATHDDLPRLLSLYGELHPGDPVLPADQAASVYARILDTPGLHVFVAEEGDDLVATCYLNIVPNLTRNAAPYAVMENVVTTTPLRGTGRGKAVVQHALAFAWRSGCYKVMLQTGSRTPATHAFYRACGFTDTEKRGYLARPSHVV